MEEVKKRIAENQKKFVSQLKEAMPKAN